MPEDEIFDVEYWELEQAKLKRRGDDPLFAGEVVVVTGAFSGIGKATVGCVRRAGAAVVGLHLDPRVEDDDALDEGFLGITCDVTDAAVVDSALVRAVDAFGGVDIVVCNAGVFPVSTDPSA